MGSEFSWKRSLRALRQAGVATATVLLGALGTGQAHAATTAPQITSITPDSGSVVGGEQVTINGSGFVGPGGACNRGYDIWFGTDAVHGYAVSPSSYKVVSDSKIQVKVPANFAGLVDVRVYNSCGITPISWPDKFLYQYPPNQCLSGTCQVNIQSTQVGALGYVGLGFLDGFDTDAGVPLTVNDGNLVKALAPRWWRLGQSGLSEAWGGEFGLARAWGAKISLALQTDWVNWANGNDPSNAWTPYNDLSTYYSFIYNDVQSRIAANEMPDYFDVWNEPTRTGTVNQWLSVYGTAYQAIKAADPSAQVEGPSIAWFLSQSANQRDASGWDVSLTDFLNWETRTGYRFAAIGYHEDGTTVDAAPNSSPGPWLPTEPVAGGYRDYWSPAAIGNHAAAAKKLIASYPSLSGTQLFVNEYGPPFATQIPGWIVGDSASLESAGADEGMLTCSDAACNSLWDGLIGYDGAPQMPYWVMLDYSRMGGGRLQTSASGANLYTLATELSGANTIEALVGRADDCFASSCPQFQAATDSPVDVSTSISIPWPVAAVDVTVQRLNDSARSPIGYNDVPAAPATTAISSVPVQNGMVKVTVPSVGDGDALYLTVNPSGATTANVKAVTR